VVIACVNFEDPEVVELLSSDLPVVAIDCECETKSSILSDNESGLEQLMDYAKELGHEKIAYITGKDSAVTRMRIQCYKRKMEEFGFPVREGYIAASEYRDIGQTAIVTTELLSLEEPPTCILFPDDYASYGGINVIRGMGMNIPEDISVAGYDGISLAAQIQPRLTTVRQDTEEMGRLAADKLIDIIERPGETARETILVKGKLVKGETFARNPELK
ncbi:MAG: substrate-binding domain-containing protein, partial [Lachnospiraceae bacterium]|nr:substrate-binding domain-containing protein [Lachnospiraceae bacterium]